MSKFEVGNTAHIKDTDTVIRLDEMASWGWWAYVGADGFAHVINEDDLKPVAMYIVTHYIWNAIRKQLKKRLLVIDEAWWMMKSEDTASFLFSLAKRGRKYFLGLATITQDVDDFLKSPYGVPMLTNSALQLLLKQSPTSIDLVQRTFNLSDEEKYLLLESPYPYVS